MNPNIKYTSSGIAFVPVLTLIFVVLKLVGVISWSWVWVLSPMWITCGLTLIIVFLALLISRLD